MLEGICLFVRFFILLKLSATAKSCPFPYFWRFQLESFSVPVLLRLILSNASRHTFPRSFGSGRWTPKECMSSVLDPGINYHLHLTVNLFIENIYLPPSSTLWLLYLEAFLLFFCAKLSAFRLQSFNIILFFWRCLGWAGLSFYYTTIGCFGFQKKKHI